MTKQGVVKLCDFGVSGDLVGSIAETFTGTAYYMAVRLSFTSSPAFTTLMKFSFALFVFLLLLPG